ncbi:MAG: hypothetical protein A2041_04110 [Bacteroidetes bacterium GWA2_31_9b]|nr:MAG: hypothetical protein A2041_04110 [Bacteroidetes bacterium GWA2_31_9b]
MEYNTSREKLVLPEYGRNIQKMVQLTLDEQDRDKRNKMAQAIIAIMGSMNPHLRDIADFKHKLWDHLAIIADFKLDIDSPYDDPQIEKLKEKPEIVPYNQHKIKYKHYGKTIEKLINEAVKMEDPERKEVLIQMLANHMKKSYLTWNKEAVSDEQIFSDLNVISDGQIQLNINETRLAETKDILAKNKHRRTPLPRKK